VDLISQFIARYRKEFDFYEQACRMAAQVLDANLQSAGIRAIVTSRAKNPLRLEAKVRQRDQTSHFKVVDEIYEDIVDLAGVRVALYFPADRDEVGRIIQSLFLLLGTPKDFPTKTAPSYKKRFSGYWATHYRVRLPDSSLNESQKRYSEAKVEIQVASVLMHAWSEVEHDLVYKPLQGKLSEEEYAILDELNGLVLTGEIALERLQRAVENRVSEQQSEYANHYDLAASLLDLSRAKLGVPNVEESSVGRVDLLFSLLDKLGLNTPGSLAKYVDALHADFEQRPLAEQVIDQLLAEEASRYTIYEQIRGLEMVSKTYPHFDASYSSPHEAIGRFISKWVQFEKLLRSVAVQTDLHSFGIMPRKVLASLGVSPDLQFKADQLRRFRNDLVHGIKVPDANLIAQQTEELSRLLSAIQVVLPKPKKTVRKTVRKPTRK